jgi:hemerythrin superfamily protein
VLTSEVRDAICRELTVHTEIEERVFYPAVRARGGKCAELVKEGIEEHRQADRLVAELAGLDPTDATFDETMRELVEAVEHHASEEETELFPRVRESFGDDRLTALGRELEQAKQEATAAQAGDSLVDLTKEELYEKAKELDVDGRSKMTKDELVEAVRANR